MLLYQRRQGGSLDRLFETTVVMSDLANYGRGWANFADTRISFYNRGGTSEYFCNVNYYLKVDDFPARTYLCPPGDAFNVPMIVTTEGEGAWLDQTLMPVVRWDEFTAAGLWLATNNFGTSAACVVELFKQRGLAFGTPQTLFPMPVRRYVNGRFNSDERQIIQELFLLRDDVFQ